jgi:hypothetical protein
METMNAFRKAWVPAGDGVTANCGNGLSCEERQDEELTLGRRNSRGVETKCGKERR